MNRVIAVAPGLTVFILVAPVLAGLVGTLAPAVGFLPALGGDGLSSTPVAALLAAPGLGTMIWLTVLMGIGAGTLSLALCVLFAVGWHGTAVFRLLRRLLSPLLAMPHAATALGLAFLIAPSGWISRLLSPWLTGWEWPPDLLIVNDPAGVTVTLFLAFKEMPFLFLMLLSALAQADADRSLAVARTLGYGGVAGWLKAVWPRVWPQIRLPFYAVIAYGASAVDVALLLGPTTPPPLAVQIVRWTNDPDLAMRFVSAVGSVLLMLLVAGMITLAWLVERLCAPGFRRWCAGGTRYRRDWLARAVGLAGGGAVAAPMIAGIFVLLLWSLADQWRFPDAVPGTLSLGAWVRAGDDLARPVWNTAVIGIATVAVALVLTIACLEAEVGQRRGRPERAMWLLYLPLLVPQASFLFGLQVLMLWFGIAPDLWAVAAVHLVYVVPYVFLSLSEPWRALDPRFATTAAALGAGPLRVLFGVKVPMLARSILTAAAVGFAVSVALYLPTLLISAGRVPTVATETLALAAGSDRRLASTAGLTQAVLPVIGFALALALPALLFRNRRGLRL